MDEGSVCTMLQDSGRVHVRVHVRVHARVRVRTLACLLLHAH